MSLRIQLFCEHDKGKYAGNVESGISESLELNTEVLVTMVVSLTKQFKCSTGFFMLTRLTAMF